MIKLLRLSLFSLALGASALPSFGKDAAMLNWYGVPGLLDMPSGLMPTVSDFSIGVSLFGNVRRTNFSFQITERLGGTLRFGNWGEWTPGSSTEYFQRSLDL
ncbi:MAG: YjbH domain-containing protein, partial [Deltaproteobacteria bacterium]